MASDGKNNNTLKLDGETLSNFTKLANFDVSSVIRDATFSFVKSLKIEDGMPPMELNELVPIVEECFGEEEVIIVSFKRGLKKVLNKVAYNLRTYPVFVSRFDGKDIEMLLSDQARFDMAFEENLKYVPKDPSNVENLVVSKDCLVKVIYAIAPADALPEISVVPLDIMNKLLKIVYDEYEVKSWNKTAFKNKISRNLEFIALELKNQPIILTKKI